MRIVHLAAGAGDMYCGACAADLALARGLTALGHEVIVLPLYTPLRVEGSAPHAAGPVFLGGINAYLQQLSPAFARLPRFLARGLDDPRLLRWVARFAVNTDPARLGPMTVSVLAGADGRQRAELERLLDFLASQPRPDLVSITNSLLSGVAPAIKQRLGVPVICGLQGEDGFLEGMSARYRDRALGLIRRNAAAVDRFVAPSESYARRMAELLGEPPERVTVIPPALDALRYRRDLPRPREPFTVGYLSAITPRKGLHLLVEAVSAMLLAEGRDVRLHAVGKVLDPRYWRRVLRDVASLGLGDRFRHLGELPTAEKVRFLHSCSVFVQPSVAPEPRGMALLEAMAAGLPVIAPDQGVFPERLARCGGGVTFEACSAPDLTARLCALMDQPDHADELGRAGAEAVPRHHSEHTAAGAMLSLCRELTDAPERPDDQSPQ